MNKKAVKVGVMLDCSRGAVYSVETLKKYIDVLKKMGFSSLQLYTEDTYEVEANLSSDTCAADTRKKS